MNGGRMFGSTIAGTEASGSEISGAKCTIFCADDVERSLAWDEIDGVRRIVREEWYSLNATIILQANVKIVRVFVYQSSSPFDLVEINDSLQQVI